VLENVVFDEHTREVDYTDKSVTGKLSPKRNPVSVSHKSYSKKQKMEISQL
jgi:ATP-dependent phosphoenolpyruvate carboxykinase